MKQKILQMMFAVLVCASAHAQVNSGSNGSDGAFNPTTNIVINMADHPNGIYQYTSVNISSGITVTFIPNANNTPVVWLVQSNCTIAGQVDVSGQSPTIARGPEGADGGPGGYRGGGRSTPGQGPGGGPVGSNWGGSGSYGSAGITNYGPVGQVYGNIYLLPLLGGSGGGGSDYEGAGGGGGAILIAASDQITISGGIGARGGASYYSGLGSGGAIRLVCTRLDGNGSIDASGGRQGVLGSGGYVAGSGRVRFDCYDYAFVGSTNGVVSQGFQPIIIPTPGQGAQLTVTSVGGVSVSASPSGTIATPDAVLSAQQNNPISIVVHCSNIPVNTQITVSVRPANGATVSATGLNNTGTLSSSTATISINMPRGGGIIYATAAN